MRVNAASNSQITAAMTFPGADKIIPLVDAMRNDQTVNFVYDGKPRTVEVHAIGTSTKDGGLVMRGFQVAGGASRPLPQWTLFRLDRMMALGTDFTRSDAPRDGYTMGDSQMSFVIAELNVG